MPKKIERGNKTFLDIAFNVCYDKRNSREEIMAMSPITSKKNSAAKQKWMKENSKVFGVRVMKTTEKDLWDYLQDKEASAVFKLALREYMENHKDE